MMMSPSNSGLDSEEDLSPFLPRESTGGGSRLSQEEMQFMEDDAANVDRAHGAQQSVRVSPMVVVMEDIVTEQRPGARTAQDPQHAAPAMTSWRSLLPVDPSWDDAMDSMEETPGVRPSGTFSSAFLPGIWRTPTKEASNPPSPNVLTKISL